jgi:phosphonopyruvate decarboxylase
MIFVENLLNILKKNNVSFFTGVPDSVLKNLSIHIDSYRSKNHKMAVNEGSAVAMGIGHYLATKKLACVYMQNSGLGNAINPLISIAHKKVYSIPLLLLVGWRGSPSLKDEPQHMVKGKITPKLLNLLNIDFCKIKEEKDLKKLNNLIKKSVREKKVVACLIENKVLKNKKKIFLKKKKIYDVSRENFIINLLQLIQKDAKIISTTGHTSRELMKVRLEKKLKKGKDFYMVGGMGHSLSVTLGMNLQSKKQIICLDGDGSALMHLGSMFSGGNEKKINLKHILLNNNSHESVGGQVTGARHIDFNKLSKSLGYKNYFKINKNRKIVAILKNFLKNKKSSFLEVFINSNIEKKLPRPKNLINIKNNFIK